jgi:hypothetical protein
MMPKAWMILPTLVLAGVSCARAPLPTPLPFQVPAPAQAQPQPQVQAQAPAPDQEPGAVSEPAPAPGPLLRAQYQWVFSGGGRQIKGTLSVLVEPATGRTIMELQGYGERLMLLDGDRASGYRVQIPRQKVDERAATLAGVPLPFFPQLGSSETLYRLLTDGAGAGVQVTQRDALGPVKLRFEGLDDQGKAITVWLERTRWEPGS